VPCRHDGEAETKVVSTVLIELAIAVLNAKIYDTLVTAGGR
jgi:hypothetical protein